MTAMRLGFWRVYEYGRKLTTQTHSGTRTSTLGYLTDKEFGYLLNDMEREYDAYVDIKRKHEQACLNLAKDVRKVKDMQTVLQHHLSLLISTPPTHLSKENCQQVAELLHTSESLKCVGVLSTTEDILKRVAGTADMTTAQLVTGGYEADFQTLQQCRRNLQVLHLEIASHIKHAVVLRGMESFVARGFRYITELYRMAAHKLHILSQCPQTAV